jgi:hypothetical protein
LRFKERGFDGTSALLNNKAASCRRTPKKGAKHMHGVSHEKATTGRIG